MELVYLILIYIGIIAFIVIGYYVYVEIKARFYLNVKRRMEELESKEKK